MNSIVKIDPKEFGLEESKAAQIEAQFKPMLDKMVELEVEYNRILSMPIESPETAAAAKNLLKQYVKVRTGTFDIHKVQKAFYLAGGRFVDGWKNAQLFASQGIEEKLSNIVNYADNLEKERIKKLETERIEILTPYTSIMPAGLGVLPEDVFQNYLTGVKVAHEAKIKAEQQAEIERQLKLKREAEEREAQRIENERLKKEAAEREAKMKAERAENEKKLRAEREKAEAKRKASEAKAKKEREEIERQAAEREAKIRLENEVIQKRLKEKEEAERKEIQRIEAEKKAAEIAEKKAKSAPDKEKLKIFVSSLSSLKSEIPTMSTPETKEISKNLEVTFDKMIAYINKYVC